MLATEVRISPDPARPLPDLRLPVNAERRKVVEWARMLVSEGCCLIDFETTGFKNPEACEVGLVWLQGDTITPLISERIRPVSEAWEPGAIGVHGITPADVRDCREFPAVYLDLLRETGRADHLVIYNRQFDLRVVKASMAAHNIKMAFATSSSREGCLVWHTGAAVRCAFLAMNSWVQEPGRSGWKWQKLPCYPGHQAHSALGDCMSTANLIQDLAGVAI